MRRDDITDFDRLIEQQDQELFLYGAVSPYTQACLDAYAEGRPIPQVNLNTPEIRRLTAQLLRGFEKSPQLPEINGDEEQDWADGYLDLE